MKYLYIGTQFLFVSPLTFASGAQSLAPLKSGFISFVIITFAFFFLIAISVWAASSPGDKENSSAQDEDDN